MNAVVLVAWRPTPERKPLWKYVRSRCWSRWPWPVHVGNNRGEFRKGVALNTAAAKAGDWDVAVIVDADLMPSSEEQIEEAVKLADESGRYVVAHNSCVWLDERATRLLLATGKVDETNMESVATTFGCIAVCRDLWDDAGGFDPRTLRSDWEDVAFFYACTKLAGHPLRVTGPVYHLWHGERQRCASNKRIADEYAQAPDAEAVRAIVAARGTLDPVV